MKEPLGRELGSIGMEEVQILYDCTSTGPLDDLQIEELAQNQRSF